MRTENLIKLAIDKGYILTEDGSIKGLRGNNLNPSIKQGFKYISIRNENGDREGINLHTFQAYLKFGSLVFNKDKVVTFKDGDKLNCSLDNIQLGNKSTSIDLYNEKGLKKCINCKIFLNPIEFGKSSRNKVDGLNNRCKKCKREYDNNFHENRSREVKSRKYINSISLNERNAKFIFDYLRDKCCEVCGEDNSVVLEFHHLSNKDFNLGNYRGKSLKNIKKEIEKCQILCANCHRIVTATERGFYRVILEELEKN